MSLIGKLRGFVWLSVVFWAGDLLFKVIAAIITRVLQKFWNSGFGFGSADIDINAMINVGMVFFLGVWGDITVIRSQKRILRARLDGVYWFVYSGVMLLCRWCYAGLCWHFFSVGPWQIHEGLTGQLLQRIASGFPEKNLLLGICDFSIGECSKRKLVLLMWFVS